MQTVLRLSVFAILIACLFSSVGKSQDLGGQLSKISGTNVQGYLAPLVSGLGASLNSGLYYSADLHSVLGFDIGVKYMYAPMKSADKTFNFATPASIDVGGNTYHAGTDYPANIVEPTVVGSKNTNPFTVGGVSAPTPLPGGFDRSNIPMLVPQASIGLPFNLEVMARFMPSTKLGDAGKLSMYGFGIRHDIDHYIPMFPIDVAVHFALQNFQFSDMGGNKLISTNATAFGLEASKSLVFLTLYAGVQIENSNFTIAPYDIKDQTGTVVGHFDGTSIKGADKARFLVGFRMLLTLINIHADYSFSKYPVLTAGVGISFR